MFAIQSFGLQQGYIYWNPSDKGANVTLSDNNRTATKSGAGFQGVRSNLILPKELGDLVYLELLVGSGGAGIIGVADASASLSSFPGSDTHGWGWQPLSGSKVWYNNSNSLYGSTDAGASDTLMLAIDFANQKFYGGINGTWENSGNPNSGSNNAPFGTAIASTGLYLMWAGQSGQGVTIKNARSYSSNDSMFRTILGG